MISASEITLQFGEHPLVENVSLRLVAGNCYGFIGANGAGKSTFIKALAGDIEPNVGSVSLDQGMRMGVLRQDQFAHEDESVLDVVVQGFKEVWQLQLDMDALYAKPDFSDADGEKVAQLQERFDELDGYSQESNAAVEVRRILGCRHHYISSAWASSRCGDQSPSVCWLRQFFHDLMSFCSMNQPTTSTSKPLLGLSSF